MPFFRCLPLCFLALTACTDGAAHAPADDDTGHETHTSPSDTDTDTDTDSLTSTTGPASRLWEMTVDCDASHTLDRLVLQTGDGPVYIDLDIGAIVDASDPSWDLFMDTWYVTIHDTAAVRVAPTEGTYDAFETLCQAPPTGFESGADVMSSWYAYNPTDHTLSPHDLVYFVETTEGSYVRLRFDGYYEDEDTLHTPGLTFGPVAAPDGA